MNILGRPLLVSPSLEVVGLRGRLQTNPCRQWLSECSSVLYVEIVTDEPCVIMLIWEAFVHIVGFSRIRSRINTAALLVGKPERDLVT